MIALILIFITEKALKRLKFLDERDWFLGDRGIVTGWGLA